MCSSSASPSTTPVTSTTSTTITVTTTTTTTHLTTLSITLSPTTTQTRTTVPLRTTVIPSVTETPYSSMPSTMLSEASEAPIVTTGVSHATPSTSGTVPSSISPTPAPLMLSRPLLGLPTSVVASTPLSRKSLGSLPLSPGEPSAPSTPRMKPPTEVHEKQVDETDETMNTNEISMAMIEELNTLGVLIDESEAGLPIPTPSMSQNDALPPDISDINFSTPHDVIPEQDETQPEHIDNTQVEEETKDEVLNEEGGLFDEGIGDEEGGRIESNEPTVEGGDEPANELSPPTALYHVESSVSNEMTPSNMHPGNVSTPPEVSCAVDVSLSNQNIALNSTHDIVAELARDERSEVGRMRNEPAEKEKEAAHEASMGDERMTRRSQRTSTATYNEEEMAQRATASQDDGCDEHPNSARSYVVMKTSPIQDSQMNIISKREKPKNKGTQLNDEVPTHGVFKKKCGFTSTRVLVWAEALEKLLPKDGNDYRWDYVCDNEDKIFECQVKIFHPSSSKKTFIEIRVVTGVVLLSGTNYQEWITHNFAPWLNIVQQLDNNTQSDGSSPQPTVAASPVASDEAERKDELVQLWEENARLKTAVSTLETTIQDLQTDLLTLNKTLSDQRLTLEQLVKDSNTAWDNKLVGFLESADKSSREMIQQTKRELRNEMEKNKSALTTQLQPLLDKSGNTNEAVVKWDDIESISKACKLANEAAMKEIEDVRNNIHSVNNTGESSPEPSDNNNPSRKKKIVILTDSNGKRLDKKKFCQPIPLKDVHWDICYNLDQVNSTLDSLSSTEIDMLVICCGTNDVDKCPGVTVAQKLIQTVHKVKLQHPHTKIVVSEATPRQFDRDEEIKKCNQVLHSQLDNAHNVSIAVQSRLRESNWSLYEDNKHILRNRINVYAGNIKSAMREVRLRKDGNKSNNSPTGSTSQTFRSQSSRPNYMNTTPTNNNYYNNARDDTRAPPLMSCSVAPPPWHSNHNNNNFNNSNNSNSNHNNNFNNSNNNNSKNNNNINNNNSNLTTPQTVVPRVTHLTTAPSPSTSLCPPPAPTSIQDRLRKISQSDGQPDGSSVRETLISKLGDILKCLQCSTVSF